MTHKIGYACISQSTRYRTSRRFAIKDFSTERFLETAQANIDDLFQLLRWNLEHNILMFRISSDIIPFASHEVNTVKWWEFFSETLQEIGAFIKDNGMRVSMHPGQYTVLNSPDPAVVIRSVADLRYHARFLDAMGLDSNHKLIIHVGGVYGDKEQAKKRFIKEYEKLDSEIKSRLILENDDTSYTVSDVLELCTAVSMPMVLDNLHHELNPCDLSWPHILESVAKTWTQPHENMKFHYSDQDPWERKNGHSQSIHTDRFLDYLKSVAAYPVDIMLEVKDKDISALKANLLVKNILDEADRETLWKHYRYRILEVGPEQEAMLKHLIATEPTSTNIFMYIDAVLLLPYDEAHFLNAAATVFSILEPFIEERERKHYTKTIQNKDINPLLIKKNLSRLAEKYQVLGLTESYYFQYTSRLGL